MPGMPKSSPILRAPARLLALLAAAILAVSAPVQAEPVFPEGSSVGLEPPEGMVVAPGFQGFAHEESISSILIAEMPVAAYAQIEAGFTPDALASQGVVDTTREELTIGGRPAFFVSGKQSAAGMDFRKWILVAQSEDRTAVITGQSPAQSPFSDDAMRTAMLSAVFRAGASVEDQIAALPFTVADRQGFRAVFVMAGSMVTMTQGPQDEVANAEQPVIIVASAVAPPPPREGQSGYSEAALTAAPFRNLQIETSERFERDGADWTEIIAKAESEDGSPLVVAQVIRFTGSGYLRGVAIDKAENRDSILSTFRKVMEGVSPR